MIRITAERLPGYDENIRLDLSFWRNAGDLGREPAEFGSVYAFWLGGGRVDRAEIGGKKHRKSQ